MTASSYLYIIAIGLVVVGWETRVYAEGDVTIYTPPPAGANATSGGELAPDGTPVIHKSLHKKKDSASEAFTTSSPAPGTPSTGAKPAATTASTTLPSVSQVKSPAPAKTPPAYWAPSPNPVQMVKTPPASTPISFGPKVETGLPVARHAHDAVTVDPVPIPINATLPAVTADPGAVAHRQQVAATPSNSKPVIPSQLAMVSPISALPSVVPEVSTPAAPVSKRSISMGDDYIPTTSVRKGPKNNYPWKTNIITTIFWIGEAGSAISATDNIGSAWDEDWRTNNGGSDSPNDRNGILPARHAARVNPFYVALPFNDLAFPDKADRWLPAGWHKPSRNGKQVSACKDRWVQIKVEDGTGRFCYAQWEDVGPLRYDHAEYVFGSQRPDTYTRAGLDVSPAVAQFLRIEGKDHVTTRWRFVDDEDVPPGIWLKYDEQAVLFKALHELKDVTPSRVPIQSATGPIDDSSNINSNKKKVGAAKG